jgi:RNA polymerase sigma-70 factor (ECF subfamily)
LWRSAPNYRPIAKFTTFLYCIAKNVCLKELAKIQKFPLVSSLDEPISEDVNYDLYTVTEEVEDDRYTPENAVLNQELSRKIQEAIASLSSDHRLVFILTEYHGMSYQEVADIVQCPIGTVASRKNAAVRKLRKMLSSYREMRET